MERSDIDVALADKEIVGCEPCRGCGYDANDNKCAPCGGYGSVQEWTYPDGSTEILLSVDENQL